MRGRRLKPSSSLNSSDDLTSINRYLLEPEGGLELERKSILPKEMLEAALGSGELLQELVDQLVDPKPRFWKRSLEARETCLKRFCFILANHYSEDGLGGRDDEVATVLLGSLQADCETSDILLALKGKSDSSVVTRFV